MHDHMNTVVRQRWMHWCYLCIWWDRSHQVVFIIRGRVPCCITRCTHALELVRVLWCRCEWCMRRGCAHHGEERSIIGLMIQELHQSTVEHIGQIIISIYITMLLCCTIVADGVVIVHTVTN